MSSAREALLEMVSARRPGASDALLHEATAAGPAGLDPIAFETTFAGIGRRLGEAVLGAHAVLDDDAGHRWSVAGWGLERRGGIPSLALRPLRAQPLDSPLTVRRVEDAESLRHHTEVVAEAFEWSPDVLARIFTPRLLDTPDWRGYVGYLDGRPVASSQLVLTDGVAGVYYVATVEDARRRGFGEAMTRHALNEGVAARCPMASLQASPMGEPIYLRMGFERCGYYRTYVPEED